MCKHFQDQRQLSLVAWISHLELFFFSKTQKCVRKSSLANTRQQREITPRLYGSKVVCKQGASDGPYFKMSTLPSYHMILKCSKKSKKCGLFLRIFAIVRKPIPDMILGSGLARVISRTPLPCGCISKVNKPRSSLLGAHKHSPIPLFDPRMYAIRFVFVLQIKKRR